MRAITYAGYGPLERLELTEVPMSEPRAGELRVRVTRVALNPKDALFRKGKFRVLSGSSFPKRCGMDFAGVVEASRSPQFSVGQRVFGMLDEWRFRRGSLADYVTCRDHEAAVLPDGVPDEAGAAVALAGSTALQALRDLGRVGQGTRVLIHGASGGVGTLAIQIARLLGAEVDTTSSAANLELCKRLGASVAWDYASGQLAEEKPRFDVVFDVHGSLSRATVRGHLAPRGVGINTVPGAARAVRDLLTRWSAIAERLIVVRARRGDLEQLAAWLASGAIVPVIDSRFSLARVHDAFRCLETKHARGKIIVEVA
jgi:NADPH2:quinone reductase